MHNELEQSQKRLQYLEILWKQDCAEWSIQNERYASNVSPVGSYWDRLQKLLLERIRNIKERFAPRWDDIYAELRAEQDELTSSAMLSSAEATLVTVFGTIHQLMISCS